MKCGIDLDPENVESYFVPELSLWGQEDYECLDTNSCDKRRGN